MRILLLGPVHREKEFLKQKGKHPFLRGQGQQSWVEAFEELGHEVFVFRYTDSILVPQMLRVFISDMFQRFFPVWKARYDRFKSAYYFVSFENFLKNRRLLSLSRRIKPQLLIISGGVRSIFPETIKKIKNTYQCKVLLFSGVNPNTSATQVEKIMIREGIVDAVVENDSGYAELWEKLGAKKVIVLPISSVDPKLHRRVRLAPQEQEEYGCDVCFVGSLTRDRQEQLAELINDRDSGRAHSSLARMTISVWGDILPVVGLREELKPYYRGTAYGEKMVKIFNASKIVLNFQPKDMTHGGNMRTFEIPGCGAFQLADRVDSKWFTDSEDIVLFKSLNDLREKVSYYLSHNQERDRIAENGYNTAYKEYTYKERFKQLFNILNEKGN